MGRTAVLPVLMLCACSAKLGDQTQTQDNPDAFVPRDAPMTGSDGPPMLGPWGTPQAVPNAASTANAEDDLTLSSTALELVYAVQPTGGTKDLYVMTRPSTTGTWSAPAPLTTFNTTGTEESPRFSADDLTIYFGRDGDIYSSTRPTVGGTWSTPAVVAGSGNTASYEKWLAVCGTNHFMVSRDNAGQQDLYEGTLGQLGSIVTELNSAKNEISTFLSPDCLTVYFASNRGTQTAIYTATRTAIGSPFSTPTMVGTPFDTGTDNEDAWISVDQRIFAFASVRPPGTNKDLYISTR